MLYNSNGKILDTSNFRYLNEGACAYIFFDNDIVLKQYKSDCNFIYFFSTEVFNKLKELNLPSIVKLYDYYYLNNKKNIFSIPRSYTMEYIDNPNILLLDQNKEYLLDIISMLEKDITTLTNNRISLFDAHHSNIIFQKKSAKIIDIDSFRINYLTNYKKLLLNNKKELLYYIKSTIINELKQKNQYEYKHEFLFDFYSLNNTSVTDYLNYLLQDGIIGQSIKMNK